MSFVFLFFKKEYKEQQRDYVERGVGFKEIDERVFVQVVALNDYCHDSAGSGVAESDSIKRGSSFASVDFLYDIGKENEMASFAEENHAVPDCVESLTVLDKWHCRDEDNLNDEEQAVHTLVRELVGQGRPNKSYRVEYSSYRADES